MDRLVRYKANYSSYYELGESYHWKRKGHVIIKNFNDKTEEEISELLKNYVGKNDLESLSYKLIDIIG